jgi:hypothetical protein
MFHNLGATVKLLSALVFLGLAYATAAIAQDASSYLGRPDCRIAPVHPAPAADISWDGKCQDGYAQGKGVLEWRAGEKSQKFRLEATLSRGAIEGPAKLAMANGTSYTGTFRNGVPDGQGYFRYPNRMQYEGEVRNGKREGVGEALYPNGDNYQGRWKDGRFDGIGRMQYALGGTYEGEWKLGKRHGKGTLTYAGSGRQYVGQFVDGRIEGSAPPPVAAASYKLKSDEPPTGSLLKNDVARSSPLPLDIGYDAFSLEQKRLFNSFYPALEEGDEPPYPRTGTREFYKLMSKVTGQYGANGDVRIFVLVGVDGRAQSVTTRGIDDDEVRKLAGYGAGLLQYKPALCQGKPCPMMFEFNLHLEVAL